MPQSLSHIILHIVFSTKNRAQMINPEDAPRLHAYLATVCREHGCHAYRVGGTADHVHVATTLSRTLTVAKLAETAKVSTSTWMKRLGMEHMDFRWQQGYGAFSISPSHLDALLAYIANQESHHHTATFQEEFRHLLGKYGIAYDERYVWD